MVRILLPAIVPLIPGYQHVSEITGTLYLTSIVWVKVKAELSLCLTNHRHEGVLGSGGMAPSIL
jgi:hypothetical protein